MRSSRASSSHATPSPRSGFEFLAGKQGTADLIKMASDTDALQFGFCPESIRGSYNAGDAVALQKERKLAEELFRHRNRINLNGRFAVDFRGAGDPCWSLFVAFLGFGFCLRYFLLRDRRRDVVAFED
jgi:hypothetical protein